MNHTPPISFNKGKNSIAFLSLTKPKAIVIFVHGLGGSALSTWNHFPELVKTKPQFKEVDVVFFGYESLKGQANNNAIRFYNFLKATISQSEMSSFEYARDFDKFIDYENILIVAHSLGSIITRRALLHARSEGQSWLEKCKMILFAPVHRGARIQDLIAESLPGMAKLLSALGFISIPVLDDLRPGSETIKNLINDSQGYIDRKDGNFTVAHTVVFADRDVVVHNERFCSDPVAQIIDKKGHMSVCKPKDPTFLQPFEYVIQAL